MASLVLRLQGERLDTPAVAPYEGLGSEDCTHDLRSSARQSVHGSTLHAMAFDEAVFKQGTDGTEPIRFGQLSRG